MSDRCVIPANSATIFEAFNADDSLSTDQVDDREDHQPDAINEVPVPRDHLNADPVAGGHLAPQRETQHDEHDDHAGGHMKAVKADQVCSKWCQKDCD